MGADPVVPAAIAGSDLQAGLHGPEGSLNIKELLVAQGQVLC